MALSVPTEPEKTTKSNYVLKSVRRNIAVASICALTLVIILLVITISLLLTRGPLTIHIELSNSTQDEISTDPKANLTLPSKLRFVTRLEWLANPPVQPANPLPVPVPYVIIHHTATENCSSQAQCISHIRYIQTFHIESRNWWDIGYNFLVGGDGEAYEGRGWISEGAHTYGYNHKSIGIAFIGTFNRVKPPKQQISACKQLIQRGVQLGYITKDYKLLGLRQVQLSNSPGEALYEEIKTWDHWVKKP